MTKKNKQKPLVAKISRYTEDGKFWKKLFIILIGISLIVLTGLFGYNRFAIYQEKQDFLAKQEKLETLADEIEAFLGEKAERSTSQTCRRTSVKFEKGEPYCSVESSVKIIVDSEKIATTKALDMSKRLGHTLFPNYINNNRVAAEFGATYIENSANRVDTLVGKLSGPLTGCSIGYYYNLDNDDFFLVSLSCTESSRVEHFPREK